MSSELIDILESESAAEIAHVLGEGKRRAEQIEAEGRASAEAYLESQRRRLEIERQGALAKAQSGARIQAAALVLQTKDQALADVFARAKQELERVQQDRARYAAILRGLIREAAGGLSGRVIIEVHPEDRYVAMQVARDLGVDAEIQAADDVRGGVRVSTPDRRFTVENTLGSRIERVRPLIASEVAQLLWG